MIKEEDCQDWGFYSIPQTPVFYGGLEVWYPSFLVERGLAAGAQACAEVHYL